jgi:hypothetical protein
VKSEHDVVVYIGIRQLKIADVFQVQEQPPLMHLTPWTEGQSRFDWSICDAMGHLGYLFFELNELSLRHH